MSGSGRGRRTKFDRAVERLLKETGLPFTVENGRSHKLVYIEGQHVATYSQGANWDNDTHQVAACIRRFMERRQ